MKGKKIKNVLPSEQNKILHFMKQEWGYAGTWEKLLSAIFKKLGRICA